MNARYGEGEMTHTAGPAKISAATVNLDLRRHREQGLRMMIFC